MSTAFVSSLVESFPTLSASFCGEAHRVRRNAPQDRRKLEALLPLEIKRNMGPNETQISRWCVSVIDGKRKVIRKVIKRCTSAAHAQRNNNSSHFFPLPPPTLFLMSTEIYWRADGWLKNSNNGRNANGRKNISNFIRLNNNILLVIHSTVCET